MSFFKETEPHYDAYQVTNISNEHTRSIDTCNSDIYCSSDPTQNFILKKYFSASYLKSRRPPISHNPCCTTCGSLFGTLFNRRNNCKNCGKAFCDRVI